MPTLDKAFSKFLKTLRGDRSYAQLAKELGIAESTLYRLINGGTVRHTAWRGKRSAEARALPCGYFRRNDSPQRRPTRLKT